MTQQLNSVGQPETPLYIPFMEFADREQCMTFARNNQFVEDTIIVRMDELSAKKIAYSFEGVEESSLQKGVVHLDPIYVPQQFKLFPAYPNPFNPNTTIKFEVPKLDILIHMSLSIFDITGRKVGTLFSGKHEFGTYSVHWNASGYASGVYFVNLTFGKSSQIQKILLLK